MTGQSRTFRIFVSSTFSDLRMERNALQERVFPRLRKLCVEHGARFQAIDLRWGVSEQSSLDQQTMNICLREIERCQRKTPRPNFIILLGDRYGWCPPPPQIPASEFEEVLTRVPEEDRKLLEEWYQRDENAVPVDYCLKPRERGGRYENYADWEPVEVRLQAILAEAAQEMDLDENQRFKYIASAAHQEIAVGTLKVEDADEHVVCFFRKIKDLPQNEEAEGFLDLDREGKPDIESSRRLEALKANLREKLPGNLREYDGVAWTRSRPTTDHIHQLCKDAYETLATLIRQQLAELEEVDPLKAEIAEHESFGKERARFFVGRAAILGAIGDYVRGTDPRLLMVWGEPGSGKSTLMAKAIHEAHQAHSEAEVIYRFIGATPESSNSRVLLKNLCHQISRRYGADEADIPQDYKELTLEFPKRLMLATVEKPLVVFLDALDQLSEADNAGSLNWLPEELPEHVRLVASTTDGPFLTVVKSRLAADSLIKLESMPIDEAEDLLDLWLEDAERTLQPEQREEVLNKFIVCPKPLYLKLAFEEARHWHSYNGLPTGTDDVPGLNEDIPGVIGDLFARLSNEANHGKLLVSRSLGYLVAAKHGLTEDELLDVLANDTDMYTWFLKNLYHLPPDLLKQTQKYLENHPSERMGGERDDHIDENEVEAWLKGLREEKDGGRLRNFLSTVLAEGDGLRLPVVLWSRLYLDLEPYLTQRYADGANLLTFYHPTTFGRAVKEMYLGEDVIEPRHHALASYFYNQPLYMREEKKKTPNQRKLSELPYQQTHARLQEELKATLTDYNFLEAKVHSMGPQPLIDDYEESQRVGYQERNLSLIHSALQLSAHVLVQDPTQLPSQMTGRLLDQKTPEIAALLDQIRKRQECVWFRPLTSGLISPGGLLLRTLSGHTHSVASVAVTPDGSRAVSGSADCTIKVWDLDQGIEIRTLRGHTDGIGAIAVTPDGRRVISASHDHSLLIWDLDRGIVLHSLTGHNQEVLAVALTPDGQVAISGSRDCSLKIWDLAQGRELRTLTGHTDAVTAITVTPDGRLAISASLDGSVRLWDLEQGKVLRSLGGHGDGAFALTMTEGGRCLVSGSGDGSLKMWDLTRGDLIDNFIGHKERVTGVAAIPNRSQIISVSTDRTLKVWDLSQGKELYTVPAHAMQVWDVAVTPDGERVVSASMDNTLKVWRLEHDGKTAKPKWHANAVTALAPLPNRFEVVSASRDHTLKVWNLDKLKQRLILSGHTAGVNAVAVSPDGHRAVSGSNDGTLRFWDLEKGDCLLELIGHRERVWAVALTPDGQLACSGSQDRTLKVWDLRWGREIGTLIGHTDWVQAVAVTPNNRYVISGSKDCTLKIWDLQQGRELTTLSGHEGAVWSVAVFPDGQRAVSGSLDGTLKVWDLTKMEELFTLKAGGWILDVVVTGNGRYVISSSHLGALMAWDLHARRSIATFTADDSLPSCAVIGDGKTFAAGGAWGKVYLLRLEGSDFCSYQGGGKKGEPGSSLVQKLMKLKAQIAAIPAQYSIGGASYGSGAAQAKQQIPIICRNIDEAAEATESGKDPHGIPITFDQISAGLRRLIEATKKPGFEGLLLTILNPDGIRELKDCLDDLEQLLSQLGTYDQV